MKKHKTYTVVYRRKREQKTDYKKRLRLLLSGKPRLVVRKSLSNISAQIIEYNEKGDKVITSFKGYDLKKGFGWGFNCRNIPCAYLVGMMIAKKAKEKGINEAILDIGLNKSVPGSRIYAVLRGAADNGLKIPYSEEISPSEERIKGKHVVDYSIKESGKFSGYKKNSADPSKMTEIFEEIKKKIIGG